MMLLEKSPGYIVVLVCLVTIYTLFNIKENVMNMRAELNEVTKQIQDETDKIHLLKAELAYLTSPARLKALNDQYIKLTDTSLAQMELEENNKTDTNEIRKITHNKVKQVRWRYKKGPSKYVTVVSKKK